MAKICINAEGVIEDVVIFKGVHSLLDNELKRALLAMPKLVPSIVDGETQGSNQMIGYTFKLP